MTSSNDHLDTSRVFGRPDGGVASPGAAGAEQDAAKEQDIDLQALACKVYALLKQEVRLERERLGRRRPW